MNKIIKYSLLLLALLTTLGCASDGWYAQQSREKFIRLSPEEREIERWRRKEKCDYLGFTCEEPSAPEPTTEEIERLKNQDSWKYKIRSWYYGVWQ
jgi:hypothetical protein